MDNINYKQTDEEVIDLKELMLFILRKWRVLILAGIIGVVLGCAFGLLKQEKSIEDLELEELHLQEIGQYARYQQLYDEQLRKEAESVYMILLHPILAVRKKEIFCLVLAVVEASRAPGRMMPLPSVIEI